ncbi:MAG: hypothetical protein JXR58_11730 [Bacteroidales bacterium]|nr:hypothetical protein [Bacteroidales bacterium]
MKPILFLSILGIILLTAFSKPPHNFTKNNYSPIKDSVDFMVCTPERLAPAEGTLLISENKIFYWSSCPEAEKYEIRLSTDADFKTFTRKITSDTSISIIVPTLIDALYYWKVRTITKDNNYSFWTTNGSFYNGSTDKEIILQRGCNGNCGSCRNPCGRRRPPIDINF